MTDTLRTPFVDQLKSLLIFLVVLGHFCTTIYNGDGMMGGVINIIYSFHMPLFIYISGYLSKNIKSQRRKDVDTLLYTYVVFQLIHYLFYITTGIPTSYRLFNIFYPCSQNWYILALFIWRMFSPYTKFYKVKCLLPFLFVVSLIIGFIPQVERFLALHQIIYWFPVFVLGYLTKDIYNIIFDSKIIFQSAMIVLLIVFLLLFALSTINPDYYTAIKYAFTPTEGYAFNQYLLKFALRVVGYIASMLISYLVLMITYSLLKTSTKFVMWGRNSLSIYLWHIFITTVIGRCISDLPFVYTFFIALVFSCLICMLLTMRPILFINGFLTNMHKVSETFHINIYK